MDERSRLHNLAKPPLLMNGYVPTEATVLSNKSSPCRQCVQGIGDFGERDNWLIRRIKFLEAAIERLYISTIKAVN